MKEVICPTIFDSFEGDLHMHFAEEQGQYTCFFTQ